MQSSSSRTESVDPNWHDSFFQGSVDFDYSAFIKPYNSSKSTNTKHNKTTPNTPSNSAAHNATPSDQRSVIPSSYRLVFSPMRPVDRPGKNYPKFPETHQWKNVKAWLDVQNIFKNQIFFYLFT